MRPILWTVKEWKNAGNRIKYINNIVLDNVWHRIPDGSVYGTGTVYVAAEIFCWSVNDPVIPAYEFTCPICGEQQDNTVCPRCGEETASLEAVFNHQDACLDDA